MARLRTRAVLTAAALTLAAAPAAASAASNPYGPARVCGAAFHVVAHHDLRGPKGGLLGTAYLMWDGGSKRNCATFIKRRDVGVASWNEVSLAAEGGKYKAQDGFFKYYAGPLYVHAPGRCVIFGARMRDAHGNGASWITPHFGHCGR